MLINMGVEISNEHLEQYKKGDYVSAISELLWNALDADATNIVIELVRNDLEGIEKIFISDNGHGIHLDEIKETFGKFGTTYKKFKNVSPKGRVYHGKQGHGRYKGFALGDDVIWNSNYFNENSNKLSNFEICGNINNLTNYSITREKVINEGVCGTRVAISRLNDEAKRIDVEKLIEAIELIFAPYLLAYEGINIEIDEIKIDPNNSITSIKDYELNVSDDKDINKINAMLKIIEWKKGNSKNRYLCNLSGIALAEEPSGVRNTMFPHTVYVMSNYFEELHRDNKLELREFHPIYKKLLNSIENILKDYYRERLADNAQESICMLKKEGVYPYETEQATSQIEQIERQVFDICAAKVNVYLPGFKKTARKAKRFTLRLLREAIEQNPSSMKKVLSEIVELPKDQLDDLANILDKTSLPAMINTTKLITNRISFINGLEQIIYSSEYEKRLLERSQLHKILLEELWIFGEQYTYGCDDISLKNVLFEHLKLLGREELANNINVNELKHLNDIPDVCLYKQYTAGRQDEYENLVIELKRPSVVIDVDEINQIERYAFKVMDNKYFDKEKTKWIFILLGTKLSDYAKKKCKQSDRAYGLIDKGDCHEIWVKEWSQVIQESKGKLKYLKDHLEVNINDNSEGMKYLKEKYSRYLPE